MVDVNYHFWWVSWIWEAQISQIKTLLLFISLRDTKCEHSFCEHQCFFWYVPFHECKFFSRNCIHYCLDRRNKLTRGDDEWGNLLPQLKYRTWTEHPEFDDSLRIDMCNSRHLQHTRRDRKVTTSKTCDCTSFPFLFCFTSTYLLRKRIFLFFLSVCFSRANACRTAATPKNEINRRLIICRREHFI